MRKLFYLIPVVWMLGGALLPNRMYGESKITVGFWNVENLFDTIPALFHDDRDYTPGGRNRWNAERYSQKLKNLARVIDAMSLDVLGLAEVEGEAALRDLVSILDTDYNWIHRRTRDPRGINVVLLYKGDKFIPSAIRQIPSPAKRDFLYVQGKLAGERVDLVVCHLPSQMNTLDLRAKTMKALYAFSDSLLRTDHEARLIIMGDFNADPSERVMRRYFHTGRRAMDGTLFLFAPLRHLYQSGYGSYVYRDRWHLYDNIFLSNSFVAGGGRLRYLHSGIFLRDWMLSGGSSTLRRGYPLRTFAGGVYLGGYSDHLPVWIEFRQ